ncbi:DNA-binding FadR family transcriptional regulator [Brevibacterium sanguinis]|uniref:DNA-binding FadR family transcriptional regulator n=2 Tax=Brevibacterium TaxID=1696 RepID=A0A366IHR8_9MICO|nr:MULTISPECIES: GntR family transcriptional regulator [Brevibacterium]RBP65103.1 DNA-binding FadR family transcriptional regulator [Brevibacterium sanguinis]RBP71366.1 DNA-binding FadR family transcriptional regulator [Brevibacterium celere]
MTQPRPRRGNNVFEQTIAQLLRAIRLGQYLVGDKLPAERELAADLGVSRATLRQALAELHTAGIVEVRRGRYGGTFVTALPSAEADAGVDPADLRDALAFRRILECAAARITAERELGPEERSRLRTAEAACAAERDSTGAEHFRALDSRFHLCIAELTGIPSLVRAAAATRDRVNAYLDRIPFIHTNITHACAQHHRLMEAILAGDPDTAEVLAAQHADGTEELLRGFLEDRDQTDT